MAPAQQILVLSPHPDDETFGCGGTIKLLVDSGALVDVLYLTRGERGVEAGAAASGETLARIAETRSREAEAACKILGVRKTAFLDGPDGRLAPDYGLERGLHDALSAATYRRIFCPHPGETHPDHAATFALFRRFLQQMRLECEVWLYEVWTPLQPNMVVTIDASMDHKRAAMCCHESQLKLLNYAAAFEGLAAYRALASPPARFAEAFYVCDSGSIRTLP